MRTDTLSAEVLDPLRYPYLAYTSASWISKQLVGRAPEERGGGPLLRHAAAGGRHTVAEGRGECRDWRVAHHPDQHARTEHTTCKVRVRVDGRRARVESHFDVSPIIRAPELS